MTRYTLHVPLTRPDGSDVTELELSAIGREIARAVGGFTATDATGGWVDDDGELTVEPMRLFAADADGKDARHALLSLADFVAVGFEQDAVYLTEQPITAHLVRPVRVA